MNWFETYYFVKVGLLSAFAQDGDREVLTLRDRKKIVVFFYHKALYALDDACYHRGASLYRGDIEECGGVPCVVCPWHHHRLSLKSGEALVPSWQGRGRRLHFVSKGCRQKVHAVYHDGVAVYVKLPLSSLTSAQIEDSVPASARGASEVFTLYNKSYDDINPCPCF